MSRCLLLVSLLLLLAMTACSSDEDDNIVDNQLTFQRENGSTITMGQEFSICCGAWEPGDERFTLKVFYYDPLLNRSFWKLFLVLDAVQADSTYSFPSSAESPVHLFIGDVGEISLGEIRNELSSSLSESSGWVRIEEIDCGPPVRVAVTIEASLGSEFALGKPVDVAGAFEAVIEKNPSSTDCEFGL